MPIVSSFQAELASVLKRTAESIFEKGGIIRSISNIGQKPTPFKISKNSKPYREACYFILEFNYPPTEINDLANTINRDVDVIRGRIFPQINFKPIECTFEEEMRPAPYRSEVQEMMANRKIRGTRFSKKFQYNNGLGYNPL
ncbi:probable 28S ribosomal protein S6, mitochondrial [Nilaparvata lugens]|uniref:probable 28S ribosomal protein S6, mitochondrial n=1 Tax=Nilaparvata lugens TaxID=108931 RepID=UPI00193DECD9|nr:probable 28S ribosomal protein S6, mitochondrial [Nilaparvata lugens]